MLCRSPSLVVQDPMTPMPRRNRPARRIPIGAVRCLRVYGTSAGLIRREAASQLPFFCKPLPVAGGSAPPGRWERLGPVFGFIGYCSRWAQKIKVTNQYCLGMGNALDEKSRARVWSGVHSEARRRRVCGGRMSSAVSWCRSGTPPPETCRCETERRGTVRSSPTALQPGREGNPRRRRPAPAAPRPASCPFKVLPSANAARDARIRASTHLLYRKRPVRLTSSRLCSCLYLPRTNLYCSTTDCTT